MTVIGTLHAVTRYWKPKISEVPLAKTREEIAEALAMHFLKHGNVPVTVVNETTILDVETLRIDPTTDYETITSAIDYYESFHQPYSLENRIETTEEISDESESGLPIL